MVWELIKDSNVICKHCDVNLGSLEHLLTCPKCKQKILNFNIDIKTKNERIVL